MDSVWKWRDWYLSPVQPLHLLSFGLLGHRLLLPPPAFLCTRLPRNGTNQKAEHFFKWHRGEGTCRPSQPEILTNLLSGRSAVAFVLAGRRRREVLLTRSWAEKHRRWNWRWWWFAIPTVQNLTVNFKPIDFLTLNGFFILIFFCLFP